MQENTIIGDQMAWSLLTEKDTGTICSNAQVEYDPQAHRFIMQSFGQEILVDIGSYTVSSHSALGQKLLHGLKHFFDLAALWYLARAKNIPTSGRLISPASLSGGEIFQKGTHVLPVDKIAELYGEDRQGFYDKGLELGGQQLEHGDCSILLHPFPRVPVTVILWTGDEEFPARTDLLFDSTCEQHLPPDVLWSTAMTTVLAML
jgi:hypothetical protein